MWAVHSNLFTYLIIKLNLSDDTKKKMHNINQIRSKGVYFIYKYYIF